MEERHRHRAVEGQKVAVEGQEVAAGTAEGKGVTP